MKHPQNPQAYGVNLLKHVNCSENIIKGSRRSESRVGVKVKRPLKFVVDVPVDRKKKPKSKSVSKEDVSSSTKKHPKPDEKHSKHLKTILKEAKEKAK